MNRLQTDWQILTLNDLQADERRAITDGPFGSNLTSAHYTDSGPRVIRLQNIGDGVFVDARAHISTEHFESLRAHEVRGGDLLIASLGEILPRACFAPRNLGPAIVKADCIRVRLSDRVDPRWVLYALQTPEIRQWASEHTHGVGRPRLGLKAIRELPIPLPSLPVQRRNMDILESHLSNLDAANRLLGRDRSLLARYTESLLRATLTGRYRGEPLQETLLPSRECDDGVLPALPAGWKWRRLGEIANVTGGITKDAKNQANPDWLEVPYLRVANVQRGRLDLSDVSTIKASASRIEAMRLQAGDVLLNEGGDRDKLARGWVWEGQIETCIHQNHVFRARIMDRVIEPRLLSWAANTLGGPWAERNGKQTTNLASISMKRIRLMPIPVPPIEIQGQLVQDLAVLVQQVDRLDNAVASAQRRQQALRRALLAAAFTGKLTGRPSDVEQVEELADV